MSAVVQALWFVSDEDTRAEMIELAREGELLASALGASPFTRSARSLTPTSDSAAVGQWSDEYSAAATAGRAMPLSVLWAGVSGWDPRADELIMRLVISSPPSWPEILNRLRSAVPGVRAAADWFSSRAIGLASGNEQQHVQERAQRAWWATYAAQLPAPPPVGTPGTTATGQPIPATAQGTPVATSREGTPWGKIAIAALVFALLGGAGRRR